MELMPDSEAALLRAAPVALLGQEYFTRHYVRALGKAPIRRA